MKILLSRRGVLIGSAGVAVVSACNPPPLSVYEDSLRPIGFVWPDTLPEWLDAPAACWEGEEDVAQIGDPIVLTAAATVAPSAGADATPNLASLTNPYGLPMELLEVRFSVYTVGTDNSYIQTTGQCIGVKMDLGKIAVVDAGVPMSGFSNYRDGVDSNFTSGVVIPTSTNTMSVETYSWRLKYPLYIPGGSTLNVKFTNNAFTPTTAQITVTYHCRMMPKGYKPRRLMVPWVCKYNSKAFNVVASEGATNDVSTELDLVNPFGVPLEMSRLIGVFTGLTLGSGSALNIASEVVNPAQPRMFTFVNMRTSQGDELVFTNTPFEALFPSAWRAWDLPNGTTLEKGEWLKLEVLRPAIDYTPVSNLTGRSFFSVSMVGYREIGKGEFDLAAGG